MSQFEKGSCFLFSASFIRQNKIRPSTGVPRAWMCWFPGGAACGAGPSFPTGSHSCVGAACSPSGHHNKPQHGPAPPWLPPRVSIFTTAALVLTHCVSWPTGGIRNSKFSKQFQYFQYICWDFYNGSWPEKVQHLPHTDTGPFPVLGVSVLAWSKSDSNFKMFRAAISWQDSTSLPIPWLIRGG